MAGTSNVPEAKSPKAAGNSTIIEKGKKQSKGKGKPKKNSVTVIQESPIMINEEVPIHIRSLRNPHFVMCG